MQEYVGSERNLPTNRAAYCTQQDGIGTLGSLKGQIGQWDPSRVNRDLEKSEAGKRIVTMRTSTHPS